MKMQRIILCLSFLGIISIIACNDDDDNRRKIIDPNPVSPTLGERVTASVSGFVSDEDGNPLPYATVIAGEDEILTDAYGHFNVANASLGKFAGFVRISKPGFFENLITFTPRAGKETFLRVVLLSKSETGSVSATTGGDVTLTGGGKIELPANGIVVASTNAAYSGDVKVYARMIDLSGGNALPLSVPGDGRGIDEAGHLKALKSFTTIVVELTTAGGQALQIKEGQSANITLPIPAALQGEAPATIGLWSLDTDTGIWKEQGTATRDGSSYTGTVTHFSFWSGAEGINTVNFTARVTNSASEPLVHVPVIITPAGQPKNSGYGRFGHTDSEGYVTGAIFANMDFVLDIVTPCAQSAYALDFSTTHVDLNLGTLTGNLGQSMVTLSGTVLNCESQPVTDGFVQTYDGGFYHRIPVTNGVFSFMGVMCTNTTVNIVPVDNDTYEQDEPVSVSLTAGNNDLGTLTACGTSTMGYITYTVDGNTVTIQEPADTIAAYNLGGNGWTQIVTLSGKSNTAETWAFQFAGNDDPEGPHTLVEVFSAAFPGGRGYWPVNIDVTITEYGKVGGFISGEFSSQMLDFGDNSIHQVECSFRVRRRN
ncbi:MAG TPA: carboxypeptidase-like regulatory domain-containing protein [Ohtaekwangia sp.]|nr:carboxypeptidase-like regulatory domain-containing protein [Ohtaekwangia sp.]